MLFHLICQMVKLNHRQTMNICCFFTLSFSCFVFVEKASESLGETSANKEVLYYGVQIPLKVRKNEELLVFEDKKEALRMVKSHPGSRFKSFTSREESITFSKQNPETITSPKPKVRFLSAQID